jgi:hypothetical protein
MGFTMEMAALPSLVASVASAEMVCVASPSSFSPQICRGEYTTCRAGSENLSASPENFSDGAQTSWYGDRQLQGETL